MPRGEKSSAYKVKMVIGDATLEIEGAESGVVKIVEAVSEVLRSARKPSLSPSQVAPPNVPPPSAPGGPTQTDIRSFFEQKQPSSDVEAAAVAAYYNQYVASEADRRDTIDSASLQQAFRMARRPLPPRIGNTLTNARNAGYLDGVGGGAFRLNAVGYNLVEHALGKENGETVANKRKPRRRRANPQRKPRK
jgi:hypothetical protein